jgi:hypothetical protein
MSEETRALAAPTPLPDRGRVVARCKPPIPE